MEINRSATVAASFRACLNHMVAGEADYLIEVVVPDLDHYRSFLVGKLLELSLIREVRSNIAIQTLKAGAVLPLDHLGASVA